MSLRALLADDEPLARTRLRRLLGLQRDIEIVEECASGGAALAALCRQHVDVLFLDIELPELDGFEVLERAGGGFPATVFVTAYAQHALRAFDFSAVDYLVKPFDGERLALAVERVRRRVAASGKPAPYPERIPVRSGARIRFIAVESIELVEAQGNYVALHCCCPEGHAQRAQQQPREELLRETLSGIEARLDPARFVRVHRRFIVRLSSIVELEPTAGGELLLTLASGRRLLSGRTYRSRLSQLTRL
jgi:two-component system, LytTR family, response regulator